MRQPFVKLTFAGSPAERQPSRTEIVEHEFKHDLAMLTVPNASVDMKRYRSGVPVRLAWGTGPTASREFIGYVSHVEPMLASDTDKKKVVCIGASFVAKEGGYDSFKNLTASAMVRQIATKFRFDAANVQNHTRVFPSLSQNGRSYWQLLIELADRVGYTLYCRGTVLYFHDRLAALSKQRSVPIFGGTTGLEIIKFNSSIGKATPTGGTLAHRAVYGVNPHTGRPLLAQQKSDAQRPLLGRTALEALFTQGDATTSVNSIEEGQAHLSAQASANQLAVTAAAVLDGNARVRVGDAIFLVGLGPINSGRWYVVGTRHVFDGPTAYQTHVDLGRDGVVATTAAPPASGALAATRSSRLVNGLWVAA